MTAPRSGPAPTPGTSAPGSTSGTAGSVGPAGGAGSGSGSTSRLQAALLRFAAALTARPWLVLGAWLLLIAAATPFALDLHSVLTKQGASKIVAGTGSARADQVVEHSFPQHGNRETTVTVSAPDVDAAGVRRLLAGLDHRIAQRVATGEVLSTTSAYTVRRDAAADRLRQIRNDAAAHGASVAARLAYVDDGLRSGALPAALGDAARQAVSAPDAAGVPALAAHLAATADWRSFPVTVPTALTAGLEGADGRLTLVSVAFGPRAGDDPDVDWLRSAAADALRAAGSPPGASVHVTGELALIHDTYQRADADNGRMETAAYIVILIVLVLFFRALLPAVLTVAAIGLAMNVSQAALYALGHQVTLTQFTVTIMTFVMLGAGVDYSMLLSSRYRQERLAGRPPREAAVHATAHAGESMLLAAGAVVLAFGATLLSPVDWIPPLGYGGLLGVPVILLAALTLTPCLLVLLGDRFFALGRGALGDLENDSALGRHLGRAARLASRRRVLIVVVFLAVTAPLALVTARHTSTADPVALSPATDSRTGYRLVEGEFGSGAVLPTVIAGPAAPGVLSGGRLTGHGRQALASLTGRLAADPGVARVQAADRPFGIALDAAQDAALPGPVRADYAAADGALRIVVTLRGDPYSAAATATVDRLDHTVRAAADVGALHTGGATRVDQEYGRALNQSFWQMVVLVSVGVFVMLVLALRSLLIPLRLIATIMMSNVWAIGLTVLIFHNLRHEAVIDDLPIFLTVLMMGLGMDYEIFLITRVRDLVRVGYDQEAATVDAVVDTGRVINAAGLVMAGSLGAMALSSTIMLREYGAGLGLAVLLDATLIRMLFVPATLLLLRRYNWWLPSLPRRRSRAGAGGRPV